MPQKISRLQPFEFLGHLIMSFHFQVACHLLILIVENDGKRLFVWN